MRKVHRLGSEDPMLSGNVITPSSWRAGKELAERILRENAYKRDERGGDDDREEEEEVHRKPSSADHSPPSLPSLSSYHDSLDDDYHLHSGYSSLLMGPSSHTHSGASSPGRREGSGGSSRHDGPTAGKRDVDLNSERSSSHDSILDSRPRAAKLSSDVNRLLEELQATSHEMKAHEKDREEAGVRGGVATIEGSRGKVTWGVGGASAGPATKRTKYEPVEPSYSTERVRHYNQPEVQVSLK